MTRPQVSVTIITLNEEENIPRAVESVRWADEVVVVDSGSSDRTVEIATRMGARVLHHAWQGYGQQKNFAQQNATYDWVLNIDADEEVPPALADEIQSALRSVAEGKSNAAGFDFPRKTFFLGQWIRYGGWYPNHLVRLTHRTKSSWTEPHVHEALHVKGPIARLKNPLNHYSFRKIEDQIWTNVRFSRLGSENLKRAGAGPSLALLMFKPLGKFIETYFIKRGFLDGIAGFIISINAAHSIFLKYAYLFEEGIITRANTKTLPKRDNETCDC